MIVLVVLSAFSAFGQTTDPNPDSPTPVLISDSDSTRALAISPVRRAGKMTGAESPAFPLYAKAVLYVTNVDLMDDEGATAFRVNVEDAKGRTYRFPVLDLQPLKERPGVYALTVELRDELNFREQPAATGDVAVSVAWRGLESNWLRLGLGQIGGSLPKDTQMLPSPMPNGLKTAVSSAVKSEGKSEIINSPDYIGYKYSGDRTRFMEQATFGPTAAMDEHIRRVGLRIWLAEQFDEPYPTNAFPNFPLMPATPPSDCNGTSGTNDPIDPDPLCSRNVYSMYPVQNWFFKESFYGDAQLHHRVTWAMSQMWVTSGIDIQQSSHMTAYYKVLADNAFGNYRTLMQQMTLNPAMGDYLDMVRSTKNSSNENYAREILQLFNIGLFQLNPDGTQKLDASNNPIPTYDQTTVINFAKVFTGWGFCNTAANCPSFVLGTNNFKDPMFLNQNNHNIEAKTLLDYPNPVNTNIAANLNGNTELTQALDNIYNHPNVAPFVSRFLIQHLVTSDPTPAYVGRVAAVFNANRTNPTQMKEVVKAILLDPEARGNVKTDPNYGKLREPAQLLTNLLRQFNVQSATGTAQSDGYLAPQTNNMAQNVFYSPTVFNYYPPDYIVPGPGINGPEFALMTTGTSIARANFVNTMVFGRVNVNSPVVPNGTSLNFADVQALAAADTTSNQLLDALNTKMMHGTMTAQNRSTLLTAINAVAATDPLTRAKTAVYLIATSSQYQVQR
ncbi:MAG: DUF1800 domain-containing protein [Acidobacteriota bacterium]|nr:DUF1800 domain-containing protein [Acidobacteriota bacterium]